MYSPRPIDLDTFSEQELQIEGYTHMPTDYYKNTVMEPEVMLTLRPSFGEYDALGERHEAISSQIESLNQAMKLSRQRGAFQELQNQMATVKKLVKEREEIDGKMATIDLARKKTDDHNIATGMETSYTEQLDSVNSRINRLQELLLDFSEAMEEGEFDFTRCVRPDGTSFGTRGSCVAPNRAQVAPAKPGGGLTDREKAAYKAGGGNAAGMKGRSIDQTIAQGRKNLERMDQSRGGTSGQVPGNRLTTREEVAYKAGGGNAAGMKGKSINETIAQGKKNLERMDQGRGRSGMVRSEAEANRAGKPLSAQERAAYKAGGGDAAARRNVGGMDQAIDQGLKNLSKKRSSNLG